MKKTLTILLSIVLSTLLFVGCTPTTDDAAQTSSQDETSSQAEDETSPDSQAEEEEVADPVDVRALALKGPTAMGMVKFMDDVDNGIITDNNYSFSLVGAPDEIAALVAKGEVDIAAVPANLASVLYNNTEKGVKVATINTLGVLYIVENGETVTSVGDLRGKTIYASGKGATPEYSLRYILEQNGINPDTDVTIEWKSEHAEVVAGIAAEQNAIAMLPQPFVATAMTQNEALTVRLDLTEEWEKTQTDSETPSELITGVLIVRTQFLEENPQAVEAFLEHYEASVEYVNSDVEAGAALVGKYEIVSEQVAVKAIPECNISYIVGDEMEQSLSGYLNVLFTQNPESVGGELPDENFYYKAQSE